MLFLPILQINYNANSNLYMLRLNGYIPRNLLYFPHFSAGTTLQEPKPKPKQQQEHEQ